MAEPLDPAANMFKPTDKILNIEGHCLCGKVRYKVRGPLIYNVLCHCENCRRATGSTFLCATIIPKESFSLLSGEDDVKIYEDGQTQSTQPLQRHFCSTCGSNVFAKTPVVPDIVSIFAGSWVQKLDDWVPMKEQFCYQRIVGDWLDLPESVRRTRTNTLSEVLGKGEKV